MNRRSFLRGAAGALVTAPIAAVARPVPAAIPAAIDTNLGTITAGAIQSGAIRAEKICVERLVFYQGGMKLFDANGVPRVLIGHFDVRGDMGARIGGRHAD